MKIISSAAHGVLDYLIAALLLLMPSFFLKPGSVADIFSVITGILQVILAFFTRYRIGIIKFLSFRIHGFIELGIAITFLIVAFGFLSDGLARVFCYYLCFSVLYSAVFILTDLKVPDADKLPVKWRKGQRDGADLL